jgi:hypothetical protein
LVRKNIFQFFMTRKLKNVVKHCESNSRSNHCLAATRQVYICSINNSQYQVQWMLLYGLTFSQTITDPIYQMIAITKYMSYKSMPLRDIWDLFNLGQFNLINWMIPLTVIPLIGAHCSTYFPYIFKIQEVSQLNLTDPSFRLHYLTERKPPWPRS